MQIPKKYQKLICFDLDETLIKGHSQNALAAAEDKKLKEEGIQFSPEEIDMFLEEFLSNENTGLKNPEKIKESMTQSLAQGYHLAITTSNEFPGVSEKVLSKIGLTSEQIEKIHIVTPKELEDWDFESDQDNSKALFIKVAQDKRGIQNNSQCYLVDDNELYTKDAVKKGYKGILVDNSNNYLEDLRKLNIISLTESAIRREIRRAAEEGKEIDVEGLCKKDLVLIPKEGEEELFYLQLLTPLPSPRKTPHQTRSDTTANQFDTFPIRDASEANDTTAKQFDTFLIKGEAEGGDQTTLQLDTSLIG